MPYTVARPRPLPLPFGLVVKNDSKAWARVESSMPVPLPVTIQHDARGLDDEFSPVRHRVACVQHEVEEHLLDLPGVGLDRLEIRAETHLRVDAFTNDAGQDLQQAADRLVEIQDHRIKKLLAAE